MAADKKPQPSASPSMLYHGDQLTSRLHHLTSVNGLDPMQAELSMLQHFSQNKLMELPPRKERETAERAARANELRHFCAPDVDSGLLEHALKQYAFEGMLLKVANEEGEIIDPRHLDEAFLSYSNPWDYPYTRLEEFRKVKFCSDDSGQLKISALDSSETPLTSFRNLDDWCFMEHLDHNTLLQVLKEAQFTLPYLDTYYHKRDHTLLLALHNPVGQDGRSSSSWNSKLHSNVGFRNYLDHVVSSIDSWVQEKERAKREATRTPTPPPPAIDEPTPPLKVE
ncbi:predicted protein [Nematostella vectensis]|uniref:Uncharacterized protein n=1 Tax=Nematostella vectensis TaxID=45351 RepID=A7T968_NEMVE|nr:predicted protein [Nematostella vectensis]|eukprot:XP_001619562.1 hypothetical protein NEMVEDRAFT_v1g224064 [Nematostella vectensis]